MHICANVLLSDAERRKQTLWLPLVRISLSNFCSWSPRKCVETWRQALSSSWEISSIGFRKPRTARICKPSWTFWIIVVANYAVLCDPNRKIVQFFWFKRKLQRYVPLNSVIPSFVAFIVVLLRWYCLVFLFFSPFFRRNVRFPPKKKFSGQRHLGQSFSI